MSEKPSLITTRIQLKRDTTANWALVESTFVPLDGELIIYTDYKSETYIDSSGETKTRHVPAFKVGTGNSFLGDLAFVMTTPEEIAFWNNKLNVDENVTNEKLVFNRD